MSGAAVMARGLGVILAVTVAVPVLRAQTDTVRRVEPTSRAQAFALARQALGAGDQVGARDALRAALRFDPDNGIALYYLARAEALTGEANAALGTLERLTSQGIARDVLADSAFVALRTGPLETRFRDVAARLRAAAAPLVRSDTAFVLADADFIPEGIAYDPAGDQLYVGSLHRRGVLRVSRDGVARPFLGPGLRDLDQVLGIRVDTVRRRLWLAALVHGTAAPRFARGGGGWAALHAYDLRTGELVARYPAPDSARPHLLNDIAITPDGDVYVTDSEGGALYRLRSSARSLEQVHGGEGFTYPNGVTVSPDGGRLYVAHVEGLSSLALRGASAGRVMPVPTPPGVTAGGIDGLYACGRDLLAVQSVVDFQQITRFRLAPDGQRVASAEALERRHPAHDIATTGALAGRAFVYIAGSQLRRLAPNGSVAPAAQPTRSVVLRLPLDRPCADTAAGAASGAPRVSLRACELPGVEGARCGTHHVAEDRRRRSGRRIPLFVAVLPARESPAERDPLFVLSGGPGQGASALADFADRTLAGVRRRRDLVLVDLAGTGRSAALQCPMYRTASDLVGDFYPIHQIRACRDSLSRRTDLRRYVTPTLVDDLDEVRAALGYETINIYGTSYGSRAALEYVRRHRPHVRSIVLKAVAPHAMRGTMHYARDMERSLRYLFRACSADAACAAAYPSVDAELREVLRRADAGALRGSVPDPVAGTPAELPLTRGVVASTILGLLQSSNSAVGVPRLVHQTYLGETRPLVDAIVRYRRGLESGISIGMHLSVMCSEDAPRMDLARAAVDDRGTALGDYRVRQLAAACREWPKGDVPADYATPVRSDVPALLVSGTLDPNTNEAWGAEAARHLSRATHVVIPNLSHGFSSVMQCGAAFMAAFVAAGSADGVDFSCKDRVRLPPFAIAR